MHVTWFTLCRMSLSPKKLKELCDTPTNNDYGSQDKCGEDVDEAPHVGPASIWALGECHILYQQRLNALEITNS